LRTLSLSNMEDASVDPSTSNMTVEQIRLLLLLWGGDGWSDRPSSLKKSGLKLVKH